MTRPPLARFLDDSIAGSGTERDGSGAVRATYDGLLDVLAGIVDSQGVDSVAEHTDLDRVVLESLADDGGETSPVGDPLSLETAAAILATASTFSATEVRARIRDHLILQMSRDPVDAESLAAEYGFGDATELRAKIEGDRPLTLREYARLRVAVDR